MPDPTEASSLSRGPVVALDQERAVDVLVVEDEPDLRDGVQKLLESVGFVVATAENGAAALRFLHGHEPPGAMVIDLWMPEVDGWQLCEALSQDPVLAAIPRVALSAAGPGERQLARLGVVAALAKPLDPDLLIETVRWLVRPRESIPVT